MLETDTAIVPAIIADRIIDELADLLGVDFPAAIRSVFAGKLVASAEALYKSNVVWRKKVLKNNEYGRNYLYVFMRHWLSAGMLRDPWGTQFYKDIPQYFRNGERIK